jgi:hypothetical protein
MYVDNVLLQTTADLFINLSAGWFGIAFIVPKKKKVHLRVLTVNILYGIFCLVVSFFIRKAIAL